MCDISCVIPTLNSGLTLAETLHSIMSQKDCTARVLVVDSGSQDDTLAICKEFGVEVVYEPPGNMYRAINTGLRLCDTEWLAYTNSDDMWYADALSRLMRKGNEFDADLVYGVCDYVDSYGRFLHSFKPPRPDRLIPWYRVGVMPFAQQTMIFRKRLFDRLNGFDESYTLAADFDFCLRSYVAGGRFEYIPGVPVARCRLHEGQLSQRQNSLSRQESSRSVATNGLGAGLIDRFNVTMWRLSNVPSYVGRVMRRMQLEGRIMLPLATTPLESSKHGL